MKKILLIICLCTFLLVGCKKEETPTNQDEKINAVEKEYYYAKMEDKLIEYGKLIYENDTWLKGNITPMVYHTSLREMKERLNYDITMFINPETNKQCNLNETQIQFIVKDTTTKTKTDYEFKAILKCD